MDTNRDFANKDWLEPKERLPLPVLLMDIGCTVLGALGLAAIIGVALYLQ